MGSKVTELKALYYENTEQNELLKQLAYNYVHGLFHSKFWTILTNISFGIQDALVYSTCQSSTVQNNIPELITLAEKVFSSMDNDLCTPDEYATAFMRLAGSLNAATPIISNRPEVWKKTIVLSKPKHLMSIYYYLSLSTDPTVSEPLKCVIEDLLQVGPVVECVQENVICLMDDDE